MKRFLMVSGNAARDLMLERGFRLVERSSDEIDTYYWFENRVDYNFTDISDLPVVQTNRLFI
jgi:hypothetical protein